MTVRTFHDGAAPRMRGAPSLRIAYHGIGRIIPADAGSTTDRAYRVSLDEDHPRGCGEHERMAVQYPDS